jgi:hypothetical protein
MDENNVNQLLRQILTELKTQNTIRLIESNPLAKDWIPRDVVMNYLGYEATQMNTVEKRFRLKTSKCGKRKFYLRESIKELLETNIIK